MLTRKTLLETLVNNGFKGDPTRENVKSFFDSLGNVLNIVDEDGNAIDFDKVWDTKSVLTLRGTEALDAVTKSVVADGKGRNSPHAAKTDANDGADRTPQKFTIGNAKRKAYERKINENRAVFADVDQAEAFGAWSRLVIAGQNEYVQKKADREICTKAQVEFNQQLGGALVPQEFAPQLIRLTEQYGAAKRLANVVPMSSESKAYARKTGIASMTPIAENGTISVSDNNYGNVTLTAKKYGVLFKVSNELFNDSAISVSDDIANSIAEAEAIAIDQAYFLGDGSSTYANQIGLIAGLSSASSYITAAAWGSITKEHFTEMMGSVEYVNAARLSFACSRQFFVQVMMRLDKASSQFKDISTGNLGGGTFMGYPVQFVQVMPTATASSQKCVYFGDFVGGSMIGDRQMLSIASSEQFYFDSDSIAVRGTSRFNVNIHGAGRGETYGPICALKTS